MHFRFQLPLNSSRNPSPHAPSDPRPPPSPARRSRSAGGDGGSSTPSSAGGKTNLIAAVRSGRAGHLRAGRLHQSCPRTSSPPSLVRPERQTLPAGRNRRPQIREALPRIPALASGRLRLARQDPGAAPNSRRGQPWPEASDWARPCTSQARERQEVSAVRCADQRQRLASNHLLADYEPWCGFIQAADFAQPTLRRILACARRQASNES